MKNQKQQATDAVAKIEENGVTVVDLNGKLPDLDKAETYPYDLMADYWTPESKLESKRVFFDRISKRQVLDQQTGEVMELECAFFVEVIKGDAKSVSNGSKRLVGAIQANQIQRGTPLLITYLGKKKNATNAYQSDSWSLKVLKITI